MLLDTVNRSLKITVVTAVSATDLTAIVEYEDRISEKLIPVTVLTGSVVAGDTEICAAPAKNTARKIKEIHIFNGDSATHDVTVFILDNATKFPMKLSAALAAGKTLHYNEYNGWAVV